MLKICTKLVCILVFMLTLNILHTFFSDLSSSVLLVNFEHVNVSWDSTSSYQNKKTGRETFIRHSSVFVNSKRRVTCLSAHF